MLIQVCRRAARIFLSLFSKKSLIVREHVASAVAEPRGKENKNILYSDNAGGDLTPSLFEEYIKLKKEFPNSKPHGGRWFWSISSENKPAQ